MKRLLTNRIILKTAFRDLIVHDGETVLAMTIIILLPAVAHAEPSVSGSHLPLLWLIVIGGAALCGMISLLIAKFTKAKRPKWVFWTISIAPVLLFLIFIGPMIIALGSIFLTGRTM